MLKVSVYVINYRYFDSRWTSDKFN